MTVMATRIATTRIRDARVAGLYAVTPDVDDTERLVVLVDAALRGGARLVQYRNKTADTALRTTQARRLASLCAAHRRPLIVNDHVELALSIEAAGLHVGADDFADAEALRALRDRLGPARLLGVSCYGSVDLACEAVAAGADYVAFGSVFASATKPLAPQAASSVFGLARHLGVPLVGIGGITLDNLPSLVEAGADAAAVIGDLFGMADATTDATRAVAAQTVATRAAALAAVFRDR